MNILHIADISNSETSGVDVIVPEHVLAQAQHAEILFYNINEILIKKLEKYQITNILNSLADYNVDFVVFHETFSYKFLKIAKAIVQLNIPYIIIPHGAFTKNALKKGWLKKTIAINTIFRTFYKNARAIQCLSNLEKESTKFWIVKNKIIVSPNGIFDIKQKKDTFSKQGMKLIYIGRLDTYYKGLDLMLEAVYNIAEYIRDNNIALDIYGPNYKNRLLILEELIKKYEIDDIVKIHNPILGAEKIKVLLNSDVFIQTSRSEGFPLGIAEALNLGLPSLVTQGTTFAEFVKAYDTGWGCETNIKAIEDTIKLAHKEREKWLVKSINAISAIKNNYLWDKVSEDTIKIYKGLL